MQRTIPEINTQSVRHKHLHARVWNKSRYFNHHNRVWDILTFQFKGVYMQCILCDLFLVRFVNYRPYHRYTSYRTNSYVRQLIIGSYPRMFLSIPKIYLWYRQLIVEGNSLDFKYETDLQDEYGTHSSWVSYICMMTSSNGNIFRVTGPLCGEFTGPGG